MATVSWRKPKKTAEVDILPQEVPSCNTFLIMDTYIYFVYTFPIPNYFRL